MNQLVNQPINDNKNHLPQNEYVDAFYRIYKKINKTLKETSKTYENDLLLELGDIREIHLKISQTIKTFKASGTTLKINLEQSEGEDYIFDDFDSFYHHNTTSPYPTQAVFFEYKFLIYDKEDNKFENYVISFRLLSRLAAFEKLQNDSPDFIIDLMSSLQTTVAIMNIEYYDYVKARTFLATFDEWVKGCTESRSSRILSIAKKSSKYIKNTGSFIILLLLTCLTIKSIPSDMTDLSFILKFAIAYGAIFIFIRKVSNMLLGGMNRAVSRNIPLSYLKINKGDEKIIKNYKTKLTRSIISSTLAILAAIIIGLSTNFIYDIIKHFLK